MIRRKWNPCLRSRSLLSQNKSTLIYRAELRQNFVTAEPQGAMVIFHPTFRHPSLAVKVPGHFSAVRDG